MALFKRGYEISRNEKTRQAENRENMGKRLYNFFLAPPQGKTEDEAEVQFLTSEPINYYSHQKKVNGKWTEFVCPQDDTCRFCNSGERASYRGAYLIIDRRPYKYTDRVGAVVEGDRQLRVFSQGLRTISQLDRIASKYGLQGRILNIIRMGSGTQTIYTIESGESGKIDKNEVISLLPDKLRNVYDGTEESLMNILEEQLELMPTGGSASHVDVDDGDDDGGFMNDGLISVEDEEEEKPLAKKKSIFKVKK